MGFDCYMKVVAVFGLQDLLFECRRLILIQNTMPIEKILELKDLAKTLTDRKAFFLGVELSFDTSGFSALV